MYTHNNTITKLNFVQRKTVHINYNLLRHLQRSCVMLLGLIYLLNLSIPILSTLSSIFRSLPLSGWPDWANFPWYKYSTLTHVLCVVTFCGIYFTMLRSVYSDVIDWYISMPKLSKYIHLRHTFWVVHLSKVSPAVSRYFVILSLVNFVKLKWKSQAFGPLEKWCYWIWQNMGYSLGEFLKKASGHPGVHVMITIFCDFLQFSAKKLAFFSKTNVMIKIFHNSALFWVKTAFFRWIFRRKYF
jgi:hypothetical protein